VSLQVTGNGPLTAEVEEGLYRIAREALNNALKHANACNVSVHLDKGQETAVLEIADDGVGFDPAEAATSGRLGLEGMAERAAQLGAELTLDSEQGSGTRVRVEVPR
jgi:two-component system NarL family sensor kinase